MSSDWIKRQREKWPTGSLERHLKLNYPGAKKAWDAVKEILRLKNEIKKADIAAPKQTLQKEDDDIDW